ncbi:MAG: rod shape-determining protein MreD [Bacteroidales bacterium]|nr:rod shape-determining protein MreD [Bacteroidales bacterium]
MIIKNIIRFILLIGVQVIILNKVNFSGYIDPYLYVLFVLLLPFATRKSVLLLLAFLTGAAVDVFSHTHGVHTASTVFLAFLRPGIIRLLSPKQEYENAKQPSIREMGVQWFYFYALLLIVAHHSLLFILESFRFNDLMTLAYRILFSSLVTLVLVLIIQYLFSAKK